MDSLYFKGPESFGLVNVGQRGLELNTEILCSILGSVDSDLEFGYKTDHCIILNNELTNIGLVISLRVCTQRNTYIAPP
jgi:hypothetical protein